MNEVKNLPTVVRFGAFEVALESPELRKHGMRIQLEEKPFQMLEAPIESAGQVVRRKTLCEKLWPDTYVAFDHSLNTAINKLRSVLGDLAQILRPIETRPRLGYWFVAPVERSNGGRVALPSMRRVRLRDKLIMYLNRGLLTHRFPTTWSWRQRANATSTSWLSCGILA